MTKYVKKPVAVDVYQLPEGVASYSEAWPEWLKKAWRRDEEKIRSFWSWLSEIAFYCGTSEGNLIANPGDYLVLQEDGEIYPMSPYKFNRDYYTEKEFFSIWSWKR